MLFSFLFKFDYVMSGISLSNLVLSKKKKKSDLQPCLSNPLDLAVVHVCDNALSPLDLEQLREKFDNNPSYTIFYFR